MGTLFIIIILVYMIFLCTLQITTLYFLSVKQRNELEEVNNFVSILLIIS